MILTADSVGVRTSQIDICLLFLFNSQYSCKPVRNACLTITNITVDFQRCTYHAYMHTFSEEILSAICGIYLFVIDLYYINGVTFVLDQSSN